MSYILDALRKADAERERDPARGIHAQPSPGVSLPAEGGRPVAALALGGAVIVAAAGAYAWWQREPAAVVAPAAAPLALPAPAPVTVTPAPAPVAIANAVQPAAPPMPAPAPEPVAKPQPMAKEAAVKEAVAAKEPVAAKPEPAADRVLAQAELPPQIQRELPKLAISGGVHSDNAAQRMLIVGGQVVGEGAELAPGLVLEQIRARTAVLRFKGYRYSVAY
jgi:general secretion pathway protein B